MQVSDNSRGIAAMLVAMAGFIFNDAMVKLVSESLPLGQIMMVRGGISVVLLTCLCYVTGVFKNLPVLKHKAVGCRMFGEMSATVLYLPALFQLPIANATAILQALPLVVTAAAAMFFRDPVGWRRWTAILVGFLGVLLIVRPGLSGFSAWSFVALGGVFFMAVRDLATRQLPKETPTLGVALLTMIGVSLLGGAMVLVQGWEPMSLKQLAYLFVASVFIIIGYIFIIAAMRTGEIVVVAPFRYSIVLWAILLGYLFWDEVPDLMTLLGTGVVVLTGVYTFLRERKLLAGVAGQFRSGVEK
ncbi:RhaT family protein [Roseibium sp. TrichSKD4]|uniref:DMT family transporter n=1 Tax=Roseibium sp. TrichSKD4 TaxID=744980 RepID=UPI0001E56FFD|nr:DMT family transporter [Roseibium sp. TrichSKD4]EFO30412.1 RhaT family protein [Roseibium sp. TrichSKD4]